MTGRDANKHEAYNSSVKCNSLTIIEIMKEEYEICLVLFNDLSHYQHFPFYARQMKVRLVLNQLTGCIVWLADCARQGMACIGLVADCARQGMACIGLVADCARQGTACIGLVADCARQGTACIGLVAGKVCQVAVKF
jgi:hypothetical protein